MDWYQRDTDCIWSHEVQFAVVGHSLVIMVTPLVHHLIFFSMTTYTNERESTNKCMEVEPWWFWRKTWISRRHQISSWIPFLILVDLIFRWLRTEFRTFECNESVLTTTRQWMKNFRLNNYGPIVTCFGYELSIDTFQVLWVNSILSHSVHALFVLVQFFQFEGSRLRNDEYFHFQDLFYKLIFCIPSQYQ